MRMSRFVTAGIAAGLAAAALIGASGPASAEDTVIRYWSFLDTKADNPRSIAQAQMIAEFEKANPGVKVKVEVVHWSKMVPMVITAAGAGQAPDVALIHSARMPIAIEAGVLVPIDPYLANWSDAAKSDFLLPMTAFAYKGKVYSLPWEHRIEPVLMYRKDMFLKAGISSPPRTWAELADVAVKVQQANRADNPNLWGLVFALSRKDAAADVKYLQPLYWSIGADFYNPDQSAAVSSPAGVRIGEMIADLVHKKKVMPSSIVGVEESRTMMKAGAAAMLIEATQVFGTIQEGQAIGKNLGSAPLPMVDEGFPVPVPVAGQTLCITKDSKHPDVAWKFIQHMVSPEMQVINAKVAQNMPVRKSTYNDPWFKTEDGENMVIWKNAVLAGGRAFETNEFAEVMNDSIGLAYEEITTGRSSSVKASLDAAAARYEKRRR